MTVLVLETTAAPVSLMRAAIAVPVEHIGTVDEAFARIERGDVTGIAIGPGVGGPVRIAQRLRAVNADLRVVLSVPATRLAAAQQAAAFALAPGRPIRVFAAADAQAISAALTTSDDERTAVPTGVSATRCLDRALEHGPVGIVLGDASGKIASISSRACELLGVEEHDALGTAIDTLLPGVDWGRSATAPKQTGPTRIVRSRADGQSARIDVHPAALDPSGAGSHCALLLVDTSTERDANEKVERLRQLQLDLLSMISHDIRAPLGVIVGAVNELGSTDVGALNDEQRFLLGLVKKSVERLSRLAANVVFLGRMESGQLQMKRRPNDLRPTLKQVADDLQRIDAGTSVTVRTSFPSEPLIAEVDIERLGQALTNLLSNAIRFAKKEVLVELRADERVVSLRVVDDGPGIPADALARIFERFSRQDAPKSGTGLGLAIVHGIVAAHGGTVRAENRRDTDPKLVGASFTVSLPRRVG